MAEYGPLVEGFPVVKGILCGSLVAGSLTIPYGIVFQSALFIIAAAVFLDAVFIFGRETHILSFLAAMLLGAILGVLFALAGLIGLYMLIILVVMTIVYLYEFMSYREGRRVKSGVAKLLSR
jgi:hypothetical protein